MVRMAGERERTEKTMLPEQGHVLLAACLATVQRIWTPCTLQTTAPGSSQPHSVGDDTAVVLYIEEREARELLSPSDNTLLQSKDSNTGVSKCTDSLSTSVSY